MALYILGTQYNPNQSGVPWTQPGGPGTLVYPQQQINVVWGPPNGYPVPGQFFIESSGLFVAGCGHWQDYPRIFVDQSAIVLSPYYLVDSSGQVWQLAITNDGFPQTVAVGSASSVTSILVNDVVLPQTWALSVLPGGYIQINGVSYQANAPTTLLLPAPNGVLWGLQVASGSLQTISGASGMGVGVGAPMALVCCALCTYIQYLMPQSQFYDCVQTPITII